MIDVHTHVVPKHIPALVSGIEPRWPSVCSGGCNTSPHEPVELATVTIAGKSFREIDHRSWDSDIRLADMDATGIERQALSPMPELLSYWFSAEAGHEMCKWMNHTIANMVAEHPGRFSGLGIVPLQDPALAAKVLTDIKSAGLAGVEIGSNINGFLLGDARFEEFFAEVERLDLSIFVHALHPIGAERLESFPDLIPFAAFPLDTALTAISLIRAGVPERHPNLRLGFSHGGGAIVPLSHRLGQGANVTYNFSGTLSKRPIEYAAGFFYDNLVYDSGYMAYLANEFAPGQFFCGTDYPYSIMETDPERVINTASLLDEASLRHGAAKRFLNIA
ncbi:MAG TPA: amidohydrolase [Dehalococcoidia bacterium]|nr:amidohydrolase [Dehalococcoidia bacterium]